MTTVKKQKTELALCVLLALVILVAGLVGFAHRRKLWMFAEPELPVAQPAQVSLMGAGGLLEPAWHYATAPASVRSKAVYTPEALEWSAGYYHFWDKDFDKSIAGDVTPGEFPVLVQWDRRWGYEYYCTDYMANNGCGPTALSIVYTGMTGKTDWNPYSLAEFAVSNDLYVPYVGTKWAFMRDAAVYLGLGVEEFNEHQLEGVYSALQGGKVLVCKVGPGDFTSGGHFIVVTRLLEDGTVEVRDPNSREKSAVTWDYEQIIAQTEYVWAYTYNENML